MVLCDVNMTGKWFDGSMNIIHLDWYTDDKLKIGRRMFLNMASLKLFNMFIICS